MEFTRITMPDAWDNVGATYPNQGDTGKDVPSTGRRVGKGEKRVLLCDMLTLGSLCICVGCCRVTATSKMSLVKKIARARLGCGEKWSLNTMNFMTCCFNTNLELPVLGPNSCTSNYLWPLMRCSP